MTHYKVPFSDERFTSEEKEAVKAVLDSGWASKGELCDAFEASLSRYLGSNVCLVNTGSAALMVSLLANGVHAGDTVLVPDFTFIATASVPAILGCRIVPVDCDPETFNMGDARPYGAEVITTAVAGLPPAWEQAGGIIDGAEALGSETWGEKLGGTKHAGDGSILTTFSFQATKQLSTVEGGAIASKDEELIARCRRIADYGRTETRYLHSELGMNFRMTDLQAALGLIRLRNLDTVLRRRAGVAARYSKELSSLLRPQATPSYVSKHAWWTFLALVKDGKRDSLLKKLNGAGVDAREPWMPIHRQPRFGDSFDVEADRQFRDTVYPNSTHIWRNGILLPIYNDMPEEAVEFVISAALA